MKKVDKIYLSIVPNLLNGHILKLTFPTNSSFVKLPIILLSLERGLLSPKTKYSPDPVFALKSAVSLNFKFVDTASPLIYKILSLYSIVSFGRPITL